MQVRRLLPPGIEEFRAFLVRARTGTTAAPPWSLVDDDSYSEEIAAQASLPRRRLRSKLEAATYLEHGLGAQTSDDLFRDVGVWSWLALHFFDSVCPERLGKRKVLADSHYILELSHQRRYRHLLATPLVVLRNMPNHNRLFLEAPLSTHGDLMEQAVSRLFLVRKPSVAEALDRLYWDPSQGAARRGITNRRKPGTLRRFAARVAQAQMTYDIDVLSGAKLVQLLGSEFDRWVSGE